MRRILTLGFALFSLAQVPLAQSQTLAADYRVQDTFASSVGTIGPLVPINAVGVSFQDGTVNGNPQRVLRIESSSTTPPFIQSGVQTQTNPFISSSNYSIVLLANFNLDQTVVVATKIFDFKNLSTDAGLYINANTGTLAFIDGAGMLQGTPMGAALSSLTYAQIVLTRDGTTNVVSVYQNGALAFSFTDSSSLAVLADSSMSGNSLLTLFKDDGMGLGGTILDEDTQGNIARLRLYDGALTAAQVAALDTTIPEPSTWALLGVAAIAFLLPIRRRRATAAG